MKLRDVLQRSGISQQQLAEGIGRSQAHISQLLSGKSQASQAVIDGILAFLSKRLGRDVTYEEAFGRKTARVFASTGGGRAA